MAEQTERKILDMVEQGVISPEEGLRLMQAMQGSRTATVDAVVEDALSVAITPPQVDDADQGENPAPRIPKEELRRMKRLKSWWLLPFGVGLLMTTLGTIWMYSSYMSNAFGFGFWLSWIPFLVGVVIMAVSFRTSRSVWLHVRVQQRPGESPQRIAFSLPIPVALTRWIFTSFGDRIPGIKDQPVENVTEILENLSPEEPFYVHVNEDDGEEVEIFIG